MKIYVLDTSTIIYDPFSFKSFHGNTVVLPITVVEELDKLKKFQDETGKNARVFIRTLDKLIVDNNDEIESGIKLENDIIFKIDNNVVENKDLGTFLYGDNRILSCALELAKKNDDVILISKDISLRIRAKVLGISAEDYNKDKFKIDEIYDSSKEITITDDNVDEFYKTGRIKLDDKFIEENGLNANDFIKMKVGDSAENCFAGYTRFYVEEKELREVRKAKEVFGLTTKNLEQSFALDLLMDDNVNLVSLAGPSGTGKTLLSLAAGLSNVLENKMYEKLIIMKPIVSVGKDLGTLPGTKAEKLDPFVASFKDNLKFLMKGNKSGKKTGKKEDEIDPYLSLMIEKGVVEIEAISYLRGRSLNNAFIIIDEIQNISLHELKTIITRIGFGSKMVLIGDLSQIDDLKLDSSNNALRHAIERFKGYDIAGSVILKTGERSALATLASQIL